jgi:hypothetical protein
MTWRKGMRHPGEGDTVIRPQDSIPIKLDLPPLDSDPLEHAGPVFTAEQLAFRWRTTPGVLANRRWAKRPPKFLKAPSGNVFYPASAVFAFERDRTVLPTIRLIERKPTVRRKRRRVVFGPEGRPAGVRGKRYEVRPWD